MITKQTIREELLNHPYYKSFIDEQIEVVNSQIQSLLEQIMLEEKICRINCSKNCQANGYNQAIDDLKQNIVNAGFKII